MPDTHTHTHTTHVFLNVSVCTWEVSFSVAVIHIRTRISTYNGWLYQFRWRAKHTHKTQQQQTKSQNNFIVLFSLNIRRPWAWQVFACYLLLLLFASFSFFGVALFDEIWTTEIYTHSTKAMFSLKTPFTLLSLTFLLDISGDDSGDDAIDKLIFLLFFLFSVPEIGIFNVQCISTVLN